jgi:O-antigen/teichoic acid export membrane protein
MMNSPPQRNFFWMLAGNAIFAVSQWMVIAVLARLGSPAAVGMFSFSLAVTTSVFVLTNLNLRAFQATDAARRFEFPQYLGLRVTLTTLAWCGLAAFAGMTIKDQTALLVFLGVSSAKAFESISDVSYGRFQGDLQMHRISRSLILRGLLGALALTVALALGAEVWQAFSAMAFAWLAILLLHDLRHSMRSSHGRRLALDRRSLLLARAALPLGLVMTMITVSHNIPVYFLQIYLGSEQVGFYSGVFYFSIVGRMVVDAISQSISPLFAVHVLRGERAAFGGLLMRSLAIGLSLGLVGIAVAWVAGAELLALAYGEAFRGYAELLVIMMAATAITFVTSILGVSITAARRLRGLAISNAIAMLVTLVASAALIPRIGLIGAPIAVALASAGKLLWNVVLVHEIMNNFGEFGVKG